MKVFSLLVLLSFLIGCSPIKDPVLTTVFHQVAIIDVVSGYKSGMTVTVKENKIIEVVPSDQAEISPQAILIDGKGKYLIPGLWDAHVHLSFEPELSQSMFSLFLVNGVTSIRDTGGQLDLVMPWKQKSMEEKGTSPRVMVAGPLLDGVPTVYDGSSPYRPKLGVGAATPEEARKIVDDLAEAGVDLIKSYEMLSPESYSAVLDQAKGYGLHVTGHVPLSMDVIEASNRGLRSMEHLRNLEMACSEDYDSLLQVRLAMLEKGYTLQGGDLRSNIHKAQRYHAVSTQDKDRTNEVLTALSRNRTWQVPTLTIAAARENRVFDRESWRADFKYLPGKVRQRWTEAAVRFSQIPTEQTDLDFGKWAYSMIKKLDDKRIGIMAGTDTPIFFLTPGFSLHEELRLLVKGGLSPLKAIEAATYKPAEYFGLENELGSIEEGKVADLVLLDANPLKDITNTQKIHSVMKNGVYHSRESLDEMLKQLEEQP